MITKAEHVENERLELQLLLEAIYRKYGYDFRDYSAAHTKRRLQHRMHLSGHENFSSMQHTLIHDEAFFNTVLMDLSINVTEMFRDPSFYKSLRQVVVPHLKTYPFINVWHAGCSAGQEVYSMAIVLEEEDMLGRAQLYATDFNEQIIEEAKSGIYPLEEVKTYTKNYQKAGGKDSFANYYTADYEQVIINQRLRDKIVFSSHNLVTDGIFAEMHIIFCRNVLIYFNKELQNRVLKLFYESLNPGGFLCLGTKENLKFTDLADKFEVVAEPERIYRKKFIG